MFHGLHMPIFRGVPVVSRVGLCLLVLFVVAPAEVWAQEDIVVPEPEAVAESVSEAVDIPQPADNPDENEAALTATKPEEAKSPRTPLPHAALLAQEAGKQAVLQGLNKVTARTSRITVTVGAPAIFGNLEILLLNCWKAPPEERPEAAALFDIWEERPSEERQRIFLGWMFASSPGLSALEHPVYDVRVLDCTQK